MNAPEPDKAPQTEPIDAAWAHRDDLVLYAGRLLGAHGDLAEDVVQDAFLRLHEQAASGRPLREARPWLFRVTRNLALDERRRIRRGTALATTLEVVTRPQAGPYDVFQGREDARQALQGLGSLPPRERRTVILDQAGVAPSAIARLMDTTTNAVHQSLFRARRRMRDARAAAWALVPLPFARLFMRVANSSVVEQMPLLASGSSGRFTGGATLAGLAVATLVGGGVVAQQVSTFGPLHGSDTAAVEPAVVRSAVEVQASTGDDSAGVAPQAVVAAPVVSPAAPVARRARIATTPRRARTSRRIAPARRVAPPAPTAPSAPAAPAIAGPDWSDDDATHDSRGTRGESHRRGRDDSDDNVSAAAVPDRDDHGGSSRSGDREEDTEEDAPNAPSEGSETGERRGDRHSPTAPAAAAPQASDATSDVTPSTPPPSPPQTPPAEAIPTSPPAPQTDPPAPQPEPPTPAADPPTAD